VTIRRDRQLRNGGGVAFLIKDNIKFIKQCDITSKSSTESISIMFFDSKGESYNIINAYHPDKNEIDTDLLHNQLSNQCDHKILLGDFNSKSPSWGSHTLDKKENN
jgi:hypothetical protein